MCPVELSSERHLLPNPAPAEEASADELLQAIHKVEDDNNADCGALMGS